MKKLLILLFLSNFALRAQTLKEKVDAIISPEQVSTGILYNRISPIVDLHIAKQDTTSQEYLKQAYFELFNASYKTDKMLPVKLLNDFVYHQSTQNIVSIGALLYDFNYTEALSADKVMAKNFDSPKLLKINKLSTFIPAFLSEKPIYAGLSIPILFPAELFLTNTSALIESLEIDFGDKIKRKFVFGETHNVTFESAGKKTIRIVARLSNGTEKTVLTYLKVVDASSSRVSTPVPPCFAQALGGAGAPISATIPFTPYEPELFSNINGRLEAGYYYGVGTSCGVSSQQPLRKPILILDGFDAGDERKIGDIYATELAYNNEVNNFGRELRAQGYDVIIVNFPKYQVGTIPFGNFNYPYYRDGGSDYVERNAMAVVQLIQNINIELFLNGSTENLVVVGPSMGGLISRYALAYM